MLLKKCHVEAHNVIGFYTPASWMPPQWLPLVSPNSMWTAVFVHNVWRLVDIQEAVLLQSVQPRDPPPLSHNSQSGESRHLNKRWGLIAP